MSDWAFNGDGDRRLYCGATPQFWKPIGALPKRDTDGRPAKWSRDYAAEKVTA